MKNHRFQQKNGNNYPSIDSNGIWYILLGEKRARECRASQRKTESAESQYHKSRNPDSQKSRKTGIQWHIMWIQGGSNEPVSQWLIEPMSQSQWARARGTSYRSELYFAYIRAMFIRDQWKRFCKTFQIMSSQYHRDIVQEVTESGFIKFSIPKFCEEYIATSLFFGIISFFRGSFKKSWVNDFFVEFFCGEGRSFFGVK